MFINRDSIAFINDKLKLPVTGIEQDWEIELADSSRLSEFIDFYNQSIYSVNDKIAMMALILSSYDDYLYKNNANNHIENAIEKLLSNEMEIFSDLLNYWALNEEKNPAHWFRSTIFIRKILKNIDK